MIPYNPYEFYREGVIVKKLFVICFLVLIFFFVTSCSPEVDIKTYTISFNANGADSGTAPNNILVSSGEKYTIPSCGTLSKNGYTFSHWNTISDGSGSSYTKSSVCKAEEDLTLYAQWKIVSYTIEYDLAGGKLPEGKSNPDSYTIETETFTLNNPEREGYEFGGWRLNNGEPNSNVSIQKGSFENKKFVAIWRQFASFSVIYDPNGGEGNVDTTYKDEGQTITIASGISLVRNGYTFSHWNTKPDGTGANYNAGNVYSDNKDLTLYAQWKIVSYTIEYDLAGGKLPEGKSNPDSYTIETETFTLNNPEREGYKFGGWKVSDSDKPSKSISITKGTLGDKFYKAIWQKKYIITFDANGADSGTVPSIIVGYEGEKKVIPSCDTLFKSGYTFSHWNTKPDGTGYSYIKGDSIEESENITLYAIWIKDFLTFTYMSSTESYSVSCINNEIISLAIPESYNDKPVTAISNHAFENCKGLRNVTIPNSVKSIGDFAFWNCTSLTSVTIQEGVESIGDSAFMSCEKLTSITIPNSIKSIGDFAFMSCKNLTSITIPNITSIGDHAFADCSILTSITIPNSVKSIGDFAFWNCTNLTSVTIQEGVESIGDSAFMSCEKLTSITIPNSIKSIGDNAFAGCSILTSITIPNSIKSIGDSAFEYCIRLTSITIPNSVKNIGNFAFKGCSILTSITIPNSVESIGDSAFEYCIKLTSITIPNSIKSIGNFAFGHCKSLEIIYYDEKFDSFLRIENIERTEIVSTVKICCTDGNYHLDSN